MKNQTAWAMKRKSVDGHDYIDIKTIECLPILAKEKADETDKKCGPAWARDNLQIEVIHISILLPKAA
jgi:hypothetical protein